MLSNVLHPALLQLLIVRLTARVRRVRRRFLTGRRFGLSMLAAVLLVVWFGNALLTILFREPTDAEAFQRLLPLALMAYALWHLLKVAWKKPANAIEWAAVEMKRINGGPFSRRDVLLYRLAGIFITSILKAGCVSLLLLPDLPRWPAGFVGLLLALCFIEVVRMTAEITAHGISDRCYQWMRAALIVATGAAAGLALLFVVAADSGRATGTLACLEYLDSLLNAVLWMKETELGRVIAAPFNVLTHVILADNVSADTLGQLAAALAMLAAGVLAVFQLDRVLFKLKARAERDAYRPSEVRTVRTDGTTPEKIVTLPKIRWLAGMGPVIWRQVLCARQHAFGIALAFAIPAVLAILPLFQPLDPTTTLVNVTLGVVFYSAVLLPAALKFDFRRDFERLSLLKGLPIRTEAVVLGQIATPVILAGLFQFVVLGVTYLFRPFPLPDLLAVILILLPLNVFIFAVENLIFILSPYRLRQEGIEVFLRTTLVFTAKFLLFVAGLVIVFLWLGLAQQFTSSIPSLEAIVSFRAIFVSGIWLMSCTGAVAFTALLVRTFRRFDPSLHSLE